MNNLKINSLAGASGGLLYIDMNGNLMKGSPSISCIPGSPLWSVGGDNFYPYSLAGGGVFNEASAGTCNNYDYILKSNAVNRAWFKTDGTVGFGTNAASNTGAPEYKFHQGALRLSGANSYGGPQVVFDGGSIYGDWGIEYTAQLAKPGLNFWKPYGSANANNALFFLANDGMVGIGTANPNARLTVDAWADNGFRVLSDNNKSSIEVYNKSTSKIEFLVKSDGHVFAREMQIMAPNMNFPDYVFDKNYKRLSLTELDGFIKTNKHLPGFEKAEYYETNGIIASEMFVKQQEKIEELTLYLIELKKEIEVLKKMNNNR